MKACVITFSACVLNVSAVSSSLQSHGLQPARLLCLWNSPGKNTGVDCQFLFQGIFLTQESNPSFLHLLYYRQILYCWTTGEAPLTFRKAQLKIFLAAQTFWPQPFCLPTPTMSLFFFNWNILALQGCVGLCFSATQISCKYTFINLSLKLPSQRPIPSL